MSSNAEHFPLDPDDRDAGAHAQARRRRLALQQNARAILAMKVAKAVRAHGGIAKANAKRARVLAEFSAWSSDPANARLLNPDYAGGTGTAGTAVGPVLTDARRSRAGSQRGKTRTSPAAPHHQRDRLRAAPRRPHRDEPDRRSRDVRRQDGSDPAGDVHRRRQLPARTRTDGPPQLSPLDDFAAFEAQLLSAAKELTVGKLTVKARQMREHAHPDAITQRVAAAIGDRGVWWEGRADGMGTLTWYGTAHHTQPAYNRLISIAGSVKRMDQKHQKHQESAATRAANSAISPNEVRSIAQICADAIADLLLDGVTPAGTGGGIHGTASVTVPVLTALGTSEFPGILEGYGPIPADTAREIAGAGRSWCLLLTHPETGTVLSVGRDR